MKLTDVERPRTLWVASHSRQEGPELGKNADMELGTSKQVDEPGYIHSLCS